MASALKPFSKSSVGGAGGDDNAEAAWEQSEGSADDAFAVVNAVMSSTAICRRLAGICRGWVARSSRARGSEPCPKRDRQRSFDVGNAAILRDCFYIISKPPVDGEADFERQIPVRQVELEKVHFAVKDQLLGARGIDAKGRPQAHALQKVVATIKVISFRETHNRADDHARPSRSTVAVATRKFVAFIVEELVRHGLGPTGKKEMALILKRKEERGMPGCVGTIACSH